MAAGTTAPATIRENNDPTTVHHAATMMFSRLGIVNAFLMYAYFQITTGLSVYKSIFSQGTSVTIVCVLHNSMGINLNTAYQTEGMSRGPPC